MQLNMDPQSPLRTTATTASSRTSRSRILPKSKADVEAALAAVRQRTAKLNLQSPEKSFERLSSTITEQRQQPSSDRATTASISNNSLHPSTLHSVSSYIGNLNSEYAKKIIEQPEIQTYYDSDDDSDDSYGVSGVNLESVSAMIDRVQQQKMETKTPLPKTAIVIDVAKAASASASVSESVSESESVVPEAKFETSFKEVPSTQSNLDLINAMIDKVHLQSPKTKASSSATASAPAPVATSSTTTAVATTTSATTAVATTTSATTSIAEVAEKRNNAPIQSTIQSASSDISSDDSVEVPNVSAATQANLALYIDSLNVSYQQQQQQQQAQSSNKSSASFSETNINGNMHQVHVPKSVGDYRTSSFDSSARMNDYNQRSTINQNLQNGIVITTLETKSNVRVPSKEESIMQKLPSYDKVKLQSYLDKAKEIAKKQSPTVAEVEYVIIYARRENVPIKPILRALDTYCKDPNIHYHPEHNKDGKGLFSTALTVSSDGGLLDLDDNALDTFLNDEQNDMNSSLDHLKQNTTTTTKVNTKRSSLAHRTIERFVYFINEAIYLVETSSLSPNEKSDLIHRATQENFDDTLLRQILENPKKHVKYEEEERDVQVVVLSMEELKKSESNHENLNLSEQVLLWSNNSLNFDENQQQEEVIKIAKNTDKADSVRNKSNDSKEYFSEHEGKTASYDDAPKEDVNTQTYMIQFEVEPNTQENVQQEKNSQRLSIDKVHENDLNEKLVKVDEDQLPVRVEANAEESKINDVKIFVEETGREDTKQSQLDEVEGDVNESFFDNEEKSDASSVPMIYQRPQTENSVPSEEETSESQSKNTSYDKSYSRSQSTSSNDNDFNLQVDSVSTDKQLNESEKFVYYKIKHFDKAKQFATGMNGRVRARINKDGTKTISTSKPPSLSPVEATKELFTRRMFKGFPSATPYRSSDQWKMLPGERIIGRIGYKDVHQASLKDATRVTDMIDSNDKKSWGKKDVDQFFLHKEDITRANWFGELIR